VIRNEFVLFVGMARKIWFRRNTVVHGGDFLHLGSIARDAITSAEEYKKTEKKKQSCQKLYHQ